MELIQALHIADDNVISKSIAAVPTDHLPIIEMFHGIEGEGSYIGDLRILLRVGGCRVACIGCDTPHSWGLKGSAVLPMNFVMKSLDELIVDSKVKRVAITGGEPMHYPQQMTQLATHLADIGVESWLETSGLILDRKVMQNFDFVSFDVKTPSSGPACFTDEGVAKFKEFLTDFHLINGHVKMIVTGQSDIDWINLHFADWLDNGVPLSEPSSSKNTPILITPACGKRGTAQDIRNRMLMAQKAFAGKHVRIIAQQHAILGMQ